MLPGLNVLEFPKPFPLPLLDLLLNFKVGFPGLKKKNPKINNGISYVHIYVYFLCCCLCYNKSQVKIPATNPKDTTFLPH